MAADQSHIVDGSGSGADAYTGSFLPLSELKLQVKPPRERKIPMNDPIQLAKTIHSVKNSPNRWLLRRGFLVIALALALAWLALLPRARAVTNPVPDGGYANENTAEGEDALFSLTSGVDNTAIGFDALFFNTTGAQNTATGSDALEHNTTGSFNTATGTAALFPNTTGFDNTAIGFEALFNNTTGNNNTANGFDALHSNTTGFFNTANGVDALFHNTTGSGNTAEGLEALFSNTTGFGNTASGFQALFNNTTGSNNTANGINALLNNTTGGNDTAGGVNALLHNTTGSFNTAEGLSALVNNTTGGGNIALGFAAGANRTTGSNNIDIGNRGVAAESSHIRIGTPGTHTNTFIAGINGVAVAGGVGVIIDSSGHLGTVMSSERFKDEIKPMDKASEAILALQPVTFHYKHELDPEGIPQFGLVAEQVEKVNPDLVARDDQGKAYTVRYEAVNAMLLNEFLKEHHTVQDQGATIAEMKTLVAQQQKQIELLTATVKEEASKIQKVSDQFELSKPAPQMVGNDQ